MENLIWLGFIVLGVLALSRLASIDRSARDTAAMMKRLLAHEGIEWETEAEPSATVKLLALDAKTYVDAIRAYREQTGLGLREARDVIDALHGRHGIA